MLISGIFSISGSSVLISLIMILGSLEHWTGTVEFRVKRGSSVISFCILLRDCCIWGLEELLICSLMEDLYISIWELAINNCEKAQFLCCNSVDKSDSDMTHGSADVYILLASWLLMVGTVTDAIVVIPSFNNGLPLVVGMGL